MNTDYSPDIKKYRDNMDENRLLSDPTLTSYEIQLGHGHHVYAPVYTLFVCNALIYASRNNLLNCSKFFIGSLLGAIPATHFTCKYLFGYDKLRRLEKIQRDTYGSAKLYEQSASKQ